MSDETQTVIFVIAYLAAVFGLVSFLIYASDDGEQE
jgi:hypothetical protein